MSEIATRTPIQEVVEQVRSEDFQQQIAAALPGNVTPARFVRVTVTALRENPDVLRADRASLLSSVVRCAQDGLLPDSREAALVVFGNKVVYMPMIGGFRKIAAEHGWAIRTQVVYENDDFDFVLGMDPVIHHRPVRPGMERGKAIAAYAVAKHREQPTEIEVLTAADIEKVRQTSRTKNSGPWQEWPERMWEKTAGRRLFAKLPLGERDLDRVTRVLEASELQPGEATAALYGRETAPAAAMEAPTDTEPSEPEDGGSEALSGEVVEGHEVAFDGPEPGEPAPMPNETSFQVPPDAEQRQRDAAAAGMVGFTSGKHAGKTIAEIAESGEDGASYIRWAAGSWKTEPIKGSCQLYAEVFLGGGS